MVRNNWIIIYSFEMILLDNIVLLYKEDIIEFKCV